VNAQRWMSQVEGRMGRSYRNLRDKLPWSTMLSGVYISGVPGEQSKIFSRISNVGASKLLQNANIPRGEK
jgi:hypothetical protein